MKLKHAGISKITRPRLPVIIHRKRLFRILDTSTTPVKWISGPAGSGKTTLIASWLDARRLPCLWYHLDEGDNDVATFFYYLGLAAKKAAPHYKTPLPLLTMEYLRGGVPAFTRNYFEKLFSRLKQPIAIVLDNYHNIRPESQLHDVIREALSVVPERILFLIMSRNALPPALALFQTYNKVHNVGWEELRFDMHETGELFRSGRKKGLNVELLTHMQQTTLGWAAGLTLLMERMRRQASAPEDTRHFNPQEFFDYFATELFDKTDADTQDFLLKTSCFPHISPRAAVELTGTANAGTILLSLSRNHFFTERRALPDPVYEYHPLFREFLQARARQAYSRQQVQELLRRAGEILEKEGQSEDAADLYRLSGEWPGFVRMVLTNARNMVSQGRSRSLETWLQCIPENLLHRQPWLLYWMGVCRMPFDLLEGRQYFERAFTLFKTNHDVSGIFISWSGVAESIIFELGDLTKMDPWIVILDALMREYPVFPSPQIEAHVTSRIFMSLSLRQPWHTAFELWKEKAMKLLDDSVADASLRLLTGYYLFTHFIQAGDRTSCEHVLGIIKRVTETPVNVSPLAHGMAKMAESWFDWATGSNDRCMARMGEALEISKKSGIHLWDSLHLTLGVCACLSAGELTQSEKLIDQMSSCLERGRPLDKFYYYHMKACHCSHAGDIAHAVSLENRALDIARSIGFLGAQIKCQLNMAHLMRVTGEHAKAVAHVADCRRIGRKMGSDLVEFYSDLSDACNAFAAEDETAGLRAVRDFMTLGRKKGFALFNYAAWYPTELAFLCMKALEAGIEPDFAAEMIRKRRLVPEEPPLHIENWPWSVKIFTLGGFRLLVNDKAVEFSGKVQKKPLELLKAIIAMGGSGVREDLVTDALWPDTEGDAARISFKTTLHRIRHLLGQDEVIQLQDNRIGLNRRYCWVDAWAFEKILNDAETGGRGTGQRRKPAVNPTLLEKAVGIYRGHFLSAEEEKPWTTSMRERLRSKYLRAVTLLGNYWMERSEDLKCEINRAIECYQRGLEIDDVAEEFYQSLMLCNRKLGRNAEAVKVYQRCRDALSSSLGIAPSAETEDIYKAIVGPS